MLPTTDDLTSAWPEVSRRLARLLAARRVDAHLVPDLVQEVGLRLVERGTPFTDADDLYRYAAQIARNLHVDHLRRLQPTTTGDEVFAAIPSECDVERQVEARLRLQAVTRVLPRLSTRDRQLLTAAAADPAPSVHVSERVALHRARKRLVAALESCWAWAAVSLLALARAARRSVAPVTTAVVAAAAATVLIVPGLPLPGDEDTVRSAPRVETGTQARAHVAHPVTHAFTAARRSAQPAVPRPEHRAPAAGSIRRTDVTTPVGLGAHHEERPRRSSDSVLCVFGVPGQPTVCTPKELPATTSAWQIRTRL